MADVFYVLQASLEAHSVRTLRSMLQCLDRFGKDLFLECNHTELTLRTLNAAQSAFIVFTLKADFFSNYEVLPGKSASVKLHLRNVTSIFRSTAGVDKVWLQVATGAAEEGEGGGEAFMRVQLHCSSGLRKKFDLSFQEVTSMNAVYDKSVCPHTIGADPSVLLECLKNFPPALAEVSLVAAADSLTLQNEVDGSDDADSDARLARTEMRLKPAELRLYELGPLPPGGAVAIAFSLREFKAVLTLIKELDHLIVAHIEAPGRPVIFNARPKVAAGLPYRMECVLATVVETTNMADDMFGDDPMADPTGGMGGGMGAGGGMGSTWGACHETIGAAPAAHSSHPPPANGYASHSHAASFQHAPPMSHQASWLQPPPPMPSAPAAAHSQQPYHQQQPPTWSRQKADKGGALLEGAPAKALDDSDTEEDEDAVPGTPPDGESYPDEGDDEGGPNKRRCRGW
ncbi:cell cycle checkpoint control protein rad9a [Chrysochromulina tobinii]|uniref:Cell cycle checkpoint control protein rad9a n=1 Tax=Chrysochromulina tobinii TaxID=1460289 RepID=A0A0M0JG62_9EUKA|nr:cell cycle checkpoint control protein rad9a [Chrysochromulina tobinii]|eukprot:KOO25228.1 cell cycle checkpoint control protein rad9a [Chrysochromulina sp. CCMP291]